MNEFANHHLSSHGATLKKGGVLSPGGPAIVATERSPGGIKKGSDGYKEAVAGSTACPAIIQGLLQASFDAVYVLDAHGVLLDVNETACRRHRRKSSELLGSVLWDVVPEDVPRSWQGRIRNVVASGEAACFEDELDGCCTESSVIPVCGDDGLPVSLVVVCRAITEARQLEGQLRRCEKVFANAQRMAKVGSWDVDLTCSKTHWSDELYRILGYAPGKIKPSVDFFTGHIHPADLEQFLNRSNKHGVGDYNLLGAQAEYRLFARDGSLKWVLGNTEAEYDDEGNICRISGTVQDITERRQIEEALRGSEEKFRSLFMSSGEGIILYDHNWRIIGWNKAMERITGRAEQDFIDKYAWDMAYEFLPGDKKKPPVLDMLKAQHAASLLQKESAAGEFTMFLRDGVSRIISYNTFKIPAGAQFMYGSILRDITDNRRSEEQSQRLGRILEESLNEIYILDALTLRFIMANRGARENLGYSMQELSAMTPLEMNAEFSSEAITSRVEPLRSGARMVMQFDTLHRRKDGSIYPVEVHLHMAKFDNADVIVANVLDITQRRLAQEAIRRSEERFRAIFNNAGIGIGLVDMEGRYIQVNTCWADMLGYSVQELLSMRHFDVMHPEDRAATVRRVEEINEGAINFYNVERRFVRKDGTIFWVNGAATPLPDGKGGIEALIGLAADITDRKMAEAEREHLIAKLTDAIAQIKTLKGLLPICSSCKKIRDDKGYWNAIEQYIMEHSEAEFTHGICPDCIRKYFPEACEDAP